MIITKIIELFVQLLIFSKSAIFLKSSGHRYDRSTFFITVNIYELEYFIIVVL